MKTTTPQAVAEAAEIPELELCISCLKPNRPGTHFCGQCGTPLTSYAATAPFESLLAEGDMWRKAASRGRYGPIARFLILTFLVCLLLSIVLGFLMPR